MRKPRTTILRFLLAAAIVLLAVSLSSANERVIFKNGHTIVATSSREEGEFIFLTLADGSEVGFPKSLVRETESGAQIRQYAPAHGWSGRGPSATETEAYRRHMVQMGKGSTMLEGVAARRSKGEKLNTVGFTVAGGNNGPGKQMHPGHDISLPQVRSTGGAASSTAATPVAQAPARPSQKKKKQNQPRTRPQVQPRIDQSDPKGRGNVR